MIEGGCMKLVGLQRSRDPLSAALSRMPEQSSATAGTCRGNIAGCGVSELAGTRLHEGGYDRRAPEGRHDDA